MRKLRIGSGAGYSHDRLQPALDIMNHGKLDYIIFECLAERTIALAQKERQYDSSKGYNPLLEYRMREVLPIVKQTGTKVVTNMGAANPFAAAKRTKELADELGLQDLRIFYVTGDDLSDQTNEWLQYPTVETGEKLEDYTPFLSANAYLGCEGIVQALQNDADIIITGRVADPALVLGPLMYEFGWSLTDYDVLGKGTLAGHLIECAAHVTGGYFADPGYKDVPDLWKIGFPIAEVYENGDVTIEKLPQSGGLISEATVKEQILYEVHDPKEYFTPDVTADFSSVIVEQIEPNKVRISGATGKAPNGLLKTSIGYKDSYIFEGEISYGGVGAINRAQLAGEIISKRIHACNLPHDELKIDLIGLNSLYGKPKNTYPEPSEIRLRIAARLPSTQAGDTINLEVESLYTNGPAGGGGYRSSIREVIGIVSILIPGENIQSNAQEVI